jgi:CTP:phosphocholine cytidylyltransferase-like protein
VQIYFKVQEFEIIDSIDGNIVRIKIGCKNNAILRNIKVMDAFLPGEINNIVSHITALNRW